MSAIVIGAGGSALGFVFVSYVKAKLKYDDSLDVFGVHGMAGIWGAIATGIFASKDIGGTDGLIHGNYGQVGVQALSVLVAVLFAAVGTFVLYKICDYIVGMRVDSREENIGLDLTSTTKPAIP